MALSCGRHALPAAPTCVLLSGGETAVSIGPARLGRGGRNTEFLLSTAIALHGASSSYGLAADTDGTDGTEEAAVAIMAPDTVERSRAMGLDARQFLEAPDSYSLLAQLQDLIVTGPTHTNVNKFGALLVQPL